MDWLGDSHFRDESLVDLSRQIKADIFFPKASTSRSFPDISQSISDIKWLDRHPVVHFSDIAPVDDARQRTSGKGYPLSRQYKGCNFSLEIQC